MAAALAPAHSTPTQPCRYRPREAFKSPLWRIVSDHLDTFLSCYESRFEATYGPLRPEVEKALFAFSQCGDPNLGVTLFRCFDCGVTLAVPFSCQTRICPCCIARKAEQAAAQLDERLPSVAHRHLVISIPRKMGLRLRIQEDRRLFRELARLITRVTRRHMARGIHAHPSRREEIKKARPGIIMTQHSWGDDLGWHPHYHVCISDGVFTPDGDFYTLFDWRPEELVDALRRSIIKAFVRWGKLTEQAADVMASWERERCGFGVFIGPVIPAEDREGLRRLISYLFRSPVSFRRLEYDEGTGRVRIRLRRGGFREFEHAIEFLAALSLHVPRSRQNVVTYAGHYANSTGNLTRSPPEEDETAKPDRRRWIPWAQLIARCWQVDPQLCPSCRQPMRRTRPVLERLELNRLLKSLSQFGYPPRPPPVPPREETVPGNQSAPSDPIAQPFLGDDFNQCPPGWDEDF